MEEKEDIPMVPPTQSTEKQQITESRHEGENRGCCVATPWQSCFPCIQPKCGETDYTTVGYIQC